MRSMFWPNFLEGPKTNSEHCCPGKTERVPRKQLNGEEISGFVVGNDLKLVMGKIGLAVTSSDHPYFRYRSSRSPKPFVATEANVMLGSSSSF